MTVPLFPIVGTERLRPDDHEQSLPDVDRVTNLFNEGERPVWHGDPVPPDIELTMENVVEPLYERVVVTARIREKD